MRIRASWLVALAVLIAVVAVPSLREIWHVLFNARAYYFVTVQDYGDEDFMAATPRYDALAPYRAEAAYFVSEQAPDDPDLRLGAGLIEGDQERGLELLRKAAEKSNSATAWATYSIRLMSSLPGYESVAEVGYDPADPESVARAQGYVREAQAKGIPDRLLPEDIAPALEALKKWESVDPQNALPWALEAKLYGAVLRYDDAKSRLVTAAQRPKVDLHWHESARALAHLLTRMGAPEPEAIRMALNGQYVGNLAACAQLRQVARIAHYGGGLARRQGRIAEALAWRRATCTLGRTMQESSDEEVTHNTGRAIEAIGALPSWKWYPAQMVGLQTAPLMGGTVFYGKYHDWYARQGSAAEDAALRDRLVKGELQAQAAREYQGDPSQTLLGPYLQWLRPLEYSLAVLVCLVLFLLVYLVGRPWQGEAEASRLSGPMTLLIALVALAPLVAGTLYALSLNGPSLRPDGRVWQGIIDGALLSLIAAIALPAATAKYTQVAAYRYGAVWIENHRRVLPIIVALGALLYLGLSLETAHRRHQWAQEWRRGEHNEFALMKQALGSKWDQPQVPTGSWYAHYPVLQTRSGPGPRPRTP